MKTKRIWNKSRSKQWYSVEVNNRGCDSTVPNRTDKSAIYDCIVDSRVQKTIVGKYNVIEEKDSGAQ